MRCLHRDVEQAHELVTSTRRQRCQLDAGHHHRCPDVTPSSSAFSVIEGKRQAHQVAREVRQQFLELDPACNSLCAVFRVEARNQAEGCSAKRRSSTDQRTNNDGPSIIHAAQGIGVRDRMSRVIDERRLSGGWDMPSRPRTDRSIANITRFLWGRGT